MKIWINPEKKIENITEIHLFSPRPFFLTTPCGMWDLSSPVGDRTCTPCIGKGKS